MQISLIECQKLLVGIQLNLPSLLTSAELINLVLLTCHLSLSRTDLVTCLMVVLPHLLHQPVQNNSRGRECLPRLPVQNNNRERECLPHLPVQNNNSYPLNLLEFYQLKYNQNPLIVLFLSTIVMKKCCLYNRALVVYLHLTSRLWATHSIR